MVETEEGSLLQEYGFAMCEAGIGNEYLELCKLNMGQTTNPSFTWKKN